MLGSDPMFSSGGFIGHTNGNQWIVFIGLSPAIIETLADECNALNGSFTNRDITVNSRSWITIANCDVR
jgi:hypothetical protein